MVPFPKHLGLQKHLFRYSLKMPTCMIIFKIPFSQKHCTLYLYSNGHVWIPIYEFEICVSVKKHDNRTPTFGNSFGIQMKRLQKAVQVSPLDWIRKQYLFYGTFCNHPENGGKMSQKQSASACTHILVVFILKWEKKTSSHLEIISFI